MPALIVTRQFLSSKTMPHPLVRNPGASEIDAV